MAMLILMEDSQPAPARNSPTQAIGIFWAMQTRNTPKVVTDHAATTETFLPKLSVMNKKIRYPVKVPMYKIILRPLS